MPNRPGPPSRAVLLTAPLLVALTACGGSSTPTPTAAPTAVPLREVAACDAAVVVPEDSVSTTPAADQPPTVTVTVGQAVSFAVPRGGRLGLTGDASAGDAQLCAATTAETGTALLVATGAGYSRIGVQVGIQEPTEVLVRVTPA